MATSECRTHFGSALSRRNGEPGEPEIGLPWIPSVSLTGRRPSWGSTYQPGFWSKTRTSSTYHVIRSGHSWLFQPMIWNRSK
jgi:hypothetical protein